MTKKKKPETHSSKDQEPSILQGHYDTLPNREDRPFL